MHDAYKYFLKFVLRYKKEYIVGAFFTVTSAVFGVASPYLVKMAIEAIENGTTKNFIIYMACAVASFGILRGIFLYVGRRIIVGTSRLIERDIRENLYEKVIFTKTEFFDKEGTGKISSRVINDVENIRSMLGFGGMIAFHLAFILMFGIISELILNITLTLVSIIPLVMISIIVIVFEGKIFRESENVQEILSEISDYSQNIFSSIRLIKSFVLEPKVGNEFKSISGVYLNKNLELAKLRALFEGLTIFFASLSLIVVVLVGGKMVLDKKIPLSILSGFIAYQLLLIWPAMAIGYFVIIIQRGLACVKRIYELVSNPVEVDNLNSYSNYKGSNIFDNLTYDIEVSNLNFGILKDINIYIPAGSKVCVIGKIGSGKTTLLHSIGGLYDIPENSVFIGGVDIKKFPKLKLYEIISFVFQENFFWSSTIKDNVLLGKGDSFFIQSGAGNGVEDYEIIDALNFAKFDLESFPLYEVIGEKGVKLSGGQKERLSLARAIIKKPKILILDDPFANIDVQTERKILLDLFDYTKENNVTIIFATHRVTYLDSFDLVIFLEDGRVIEVGSPKELLFKDTKTRMVFELANEILWE